MTTVQEKYETLKDSDGNVFISLTDDLLFKEIFGSNKNKRYLEALLESYFNFKDGYLKNKLTISQEFILDKDRYLDKSSRTDLLVYFDDMIVNIEMYKVFNEEAYKKSNYYIMRIQTNQIKIGDSYNIYNKITQINFLGKDDININENIISNVTLSTLPAEQSFIHLDKPEMYLYNQGKRFYKFIKLFNAKSYKERERIAKGDELLMDFNKEVFDFCQEGEEKYLNDVYWNERIQRCEGRKEGLAEGKQQGIISVAKTMLKETDDLEFISRVTSLSIEEITNLQNETSEGKI